MEVHSSVNSVISKRLWNFLRIAFFMMRKGVISKQKLILDMNLMMKRGKLLKKSLGNLMFHHHSRNVTRGGFGRQEYEFSCSNSPNPVFLHVTKRKHHYFPCINPPNVLEEREEPKAIVVLPKLEYSPECTYSIGFGTPNLAPGEKVSPLLSPFAIRVSNYSSEDENEGANGQVDDAAEEFIRRFYDQLKMQSRTQLLQYDQEMQ